MPAPNKRSRTFRRVYVRAPSGAVKLHYKKRKHAKLRCHSCGKVLAGTHQCISKNKNKIAKTQRRAERPYGGVLCSACMRAIIVKMVRGE